LAFLAGDAFRLRIELLSPQPKLFPYLSHNRDAFQLAAPLRFLSEIVDIGHRAFPPQSLSRLTLHGTDGLRGAICRMVRVCD
jgi:hypothetical protein